MVTDVNPDELKKRHRSPNYPTVGLREAVDRLKTFYSRDGKAGAPPDIAAVHIGFSKPHGQAMSVLAALKRFGLVAESGGRIVPTQRGIEIANLRDDDPRKIAALQAAVLEPTLYRELIDQHRETGWPDPDVLESELITYKNFNPNSAGGFVKDLFDSIEFAGLSDLATLESRQEPEMPEPPAVQEPRQPTTKTVMQGAMKLNVPITARTYAFDISIPREVKGELRIVGEFGKEDLERLRKALNGQLAMIEAALED